MVAGFKEKEIHSRSGSVASAETRPANAAADLGVKLAALVSLWQHRAEALHLPEMLEDEERGLGDASPPGLRTRG